MDLKNFENDNQNKSLIILKIFSRIILNISFRNDFTSLDFYHLYGPNSTPNKI